MMTKSLHIVIIISAIVLFSWTSAGYSQAPGIGIGEIEVKGEVQEPQSIITPSRTRPEFIPASIDSVQKDYTKSAFALLSELIAPVEEEVMPKKMDDLKALLAKERR